MRETNDYRQILGALEGALFPAALWSPRLFRFVWANGAFRRLAGAAIEDLDPVGMPKRGFLSDTPSASHMQDAAYIGLPYTDPEYECVGPGGARTFYQVTFLPLQAHFADPFDVLVTAVDVTPEIAARHRSRERHDAALRSIGLVESTLLSSLDAREILERVLVEATEAVDADWGWVVELSGEAWQLSSVHGLPRESIGRAFAPAGGSLPAIAAESRATVAEESRSSAASTRRDLMEQHDLGAFMLVPVKTHGEVSRVLGFCWGNETAFTDAHLEFAHRLEMSLSLAMQNAADYALERGLRRTLQSAFLPIPAGVRGLEVGHLCFSASPDTTVGGDFYEVLRLGEDRVGVLIGDAPGNGLEAAALASQMRDAVRTEAFRSAKPDKVVRRADRQIASGEDQEPFTSLLYGSLEPSSGRFRYCATGRSAPLIKRSRGFATTLPHVIVRDGDVPSYPTSETRLLAGDTLLLYTDGLVKAANGSGESFGQARLLDSLDRYSGAETGRLPEHVFGDVFAHCDGSLDDDAAILAIRAA